MQKKPHFLIIFSVYLILWPLISIASLSVVKNFSFIDVMKKALSLNTFDFFHFWFIFPVSGILLLSVKKWAYYLFIPLQFYMIYFHLGYQEYTWPYLAESPSLMSLFLLGVNILIAITMLFPKSRRPFFNEGLRWWERGSRFQIKSPLYLSAGNLTFKGVLQDLSYSGLLLYSNNHLNLGSNLDLQFNIENREIEINSTVVRIPNSSSDTYGVKFNFRNLFERLYLRYVLLLVEKNGKYLKFRL